MAGCREVVRADFAARLNPQDPAGNGRGFLLTVSPRPTATATEQEGTMIENSDAVSHSPPPLAVTLPDGSRRTFPGPVSGAELAAAIGAGLARAAIAVKIDGRPRDLATIIDHDADVAIITREMPEGLEILRHDAAHVMAEAVKELYPDAQVTFGPATETGFYYDFARDLPFTPEDLARIEERMREIVRRDEPITREIWDRDRAVQFFSGIGERYKAEIG